eukprot:COSAG04_NODE_3303_length_2956_cov_2.272664_1_plen_116_part_00
MKLKKLDLLMLWRFSEYDSVREVAQNRDVLKLVLAELQPLFDYNSVVREYKDPRIHRAHRRLWKSGTPDRRIHPGRWLVHITYPQLSAWPWRPEIRLKFAYRGGAEPRGQEAGQG